MEEENKPVENPVETPQKTYTEEEYNALKLQLENLEKSTKDNEDFKAKWEQSEQARKDFEHKTKVSNYVKALNLKDDIYENYVANEIISKGLQFDGDKLIGGEDVVSAFKEKYPDAFKPSPNERVASPTSQNTPTAQNGVEREFAKRNPNLKF
jgi:hypothetical protein